MCSGLIENGKSPLSSVESLCGKKEIFDSVLKHRHQLVVCSVSIYTLTIIKAMFILDFSSVFIFQHEEPKKQLHVSMYRIQFSGDQTEVHL